MLCYQSGMYLRFVLLGVDYRAAFRDGRLAITACRDGAARGDELADVVGLDDSKAVLNGDDDEAQALNDSARRLVPLLEQRVDTLRRERDELRRERDEAQVKLKRIRKAYLGYAQAALTSADDALDEIGAALNGDGDEGDDDEGDDDEGEGEGDDEGDDGHPTSKAAWDGAMEYIDTLKRQIEKLAHERDEARAEVEKLKRWSSDLSKLKSGDELNETLRRERDEARAELARVREIGSSAVLRKVDMERDLTAQLETLRRERDEARAELHVSVMPEFAREKAQQFIKAYQGQIDAFRASQVALEERCREAFADRDRALRERDEAQRWSEDSGNRLGMATEENETLRRERDDANRMVETWRHSVASLERVLEQLQAEKDAAAQYQREELAAAQLQLTRVISEREEMRKAALSRLAAKVQEIERLKNRDPKHISVRGADGSIMKAYSADETMDEQQQRHEAQALNLARHSENALAQAMIETMAGAENIVSEHYSADDDEAAAVEAHNGKVQS